MELHVVSNIVIIVASRMRAPRPLAIPCAPVVCLKVIARPVATSIAYTRVRTIYKGVSGIGLGLHGQCRRCYMALVSL